MHREFLAPLVQCSSCGPWGATECAYPSIRKADLPREVQSLGSIPLDEHQWREVSEATAGKLGIGVTLLPGAGFGPLAGRAPITWPALLWKSGWCLLVAESLFAQLVSRGLRLRGSPAELGPVIAERYIEVEARPTAVLSATGRNAGTVSVCRGCGRRTLHAGANVEVARHGWDESTPIQRLASQPATLLVSLEFAEAIREAGAIGYTLQEVPVA
jgi:Protein of unknown function (Gmx_para_CXXCG)